MYTQMLYIRKVVLRQIGFTPWQRQDFSLLCNVQTGFVAHPASIPMGTEGKAAGT
jgi:hypothetical protein